MSYIIITIHQSMFCYNIIQLPSFHIDLSIVKKVFEEISLYIKTTQKWTLNIVFLSPEEIQYLNNHYRNKDEATDVLSFHYYDNFWSLKNTDIAWELVFCEEKIITQGEEFWLGTQKEFYKLLIHSILHILWFDHEEESEYKVMNNHEMHIWGKIFGNIEKIEYNNTK